MRVLWSNGHKRITLIQGAFATLEWRSYILMRGDFFVCKISRVKQLFSVILQYYVQRLASLC